MYILEMIEICHSWHVKMCDQGAMGENGEDGARPKHFVPGRHDLGSLRDHRPQRITQQS